MKLSSSKGSTPLELVTTIAMLLVPITPISLLAGQLQNELAAESIARNALRMAILQSPEDPQTVISRSISELEASWNLEVVDYRIWCSDGCQLLSLKVFVGNASAIHTMGVEP